MITPSLRAGVPVCVLAVLFSLSSLPPGCDSVQRTDLDGVGGPFDDCAQLQGTYFNDRNWGLPHREDLSRRSLWEYLTQQNEDRSRVDPAFENVLITDCTPTGFEATLRGCGMPDRHAHIFGSFGQGYFRIDHQLQSSTCSSSSNRAAIHSVGRARQTVTKKGIRTFILS